MINGLIKRFKTKPTPFLILVPLVFIFAIPEFVRCIGLTGGSSLGAILPMGAMFIATIALWIDYGLVNYSKIKLVWIAVMETGLMGCLFLLHLYSDRTVSLNVQKSKYPYLIVIDKPKGIKPRDFEKVGLFDKEYQVINKDLIYMDVKSFSDFPTDVINDNNGGVTIRFGSKPEYMFKWAFYEYAEDGLEKYDEAAIDSLISLHLKDGVKLYDDTENEQ